MESKTCPRCGRSLPLSEFHKDRSRPDGLYSYCKQCNYQSSRTYIAKKPDYYAAYQAQYRANHLSELRAYNRRRTKERYQNNKALWRQYVLEYRARKRGNKAPSLSEIQMRIAYCHNECVYCGGHYEHLDHIIPLSRGGVDSLQNLAPSCARCNLSKAASDWQSWYLKQPYYDPARMQFIASLLETSL